MGLNLLERNQRCAEFFGQCGEILNRKGADYEIGGDALREITNLAKTLGVTPVQVLWVYAYKHLTALQNYVRQGRLETEGLRERLMDIANYCALMAVFEELEEAEPEAAELHAAVQEDPGHGTDHQSR